MITPVPKPKKRKQSRDSERFALDAGDGLSSKQQEYNPTPIINEVRTYVETWRNLKNPDQWLVTLETARLLRHWRHHDFNGVKPFFCQIEAVETAIWLVEVAPKMGAKGAKFWAHVKGANAQANPELPRLALKLATGAGKTTVMAMLIAWQTVNAVRHPNSKQFSRGFLIVAPDITIRDRLQVLLPNDPESYYRHREIVPPDMPRDIDQAKIVITNYHAFKLRERLEIAKGARQALEGWRGEKVQTLETEGQMLQRVMPELMGLKNIVVLNDEAHHCYRERVKDAAGDTEEDLKGDEKQEAKENNEAVACQPPSLLTPWPCVTAPSVLNRAGAVAFSCAYRSHNLAPHAIPRTRERAVGRRGMRRNRGAGERAAGNPLILATMRFAIRFSSVVACLRS